MDPVTTLINALQGDRFARSEYNAWIGRGGFPARVQVSAWTDTWMRGIRSLEVTKVGTKYIHGVHSGGTKIRLPFSALSEVIA